MSDLASAAKRLAGSAPTAFPACGLLWDVASFQASQWTSLCFPLRKFRKFSIFVIHLPPTSRWLWDRLSDSPALGAGQLAGKGMAPCKLASAVRNLGERHRYRLGQRQPRAPCDCQLHKPQPPQTQCHCCGALSPPAHQLESGVSAHGLGLCGTCDTCDTLMWHTHVTFLWTLGFVSHYTERSSSYTEVMHMHIVNIICLVHSG